VRPNEIGMAAQRKQVCQDLTSVSRHEYFEV
jgi:hypothetical protein